MSTTLRIAQVAEEDIEDARSWYETQRRGLGMEFLTELSIVLDGIGEHPHMFPIFRRNVRRTRLRRFPFIIFYRMIENDAVVIAVLHASRGASALRRRLS